MNASCYTHARTSHVTHMHEPFYTQFEHLSLCASANESCHTYEWVMSHTWMSHVTHMNESCHRYEPVTSHIWQIPITYDTSCHTYECVVSHTWMSRVARMKWVVTHIWISGVARVNEWWDTYEWDTFECVMSRNTHIKKLWHTNES